MLGKRILLLLLAVLCCLGWTVQAKSTKSVVNYCINCDSEVRPGGDEGPTFTDIDKMEAMRCGHHINVCNNCFNALMVSNEERTIVPCPLCHGSLKLNSAMKERVKVDQLRQLKLRIENMNSLLRWPLHMDAVLRKWPQLFEFGRLDVVCGDEHIELFFCAYRAVHYQSPNLENTVTHTIQSFAVDLASVRLNLLGQLGPRFKYFQDAPVYDYYGEILTLGQAAVRSLNILDGQVIQETLKEVARSLSGATLANVISELRVYPEVALFQQETIQINGVNLDLSIQGALLLLQIPLLQTESIKNMLTSLDQGFLEAEPMVDGFIAERWPDLVPFKNMGRLTYDAKPNTIRNFAKLVLNPAMDFQEAKAYLNELQISAAAPSQNLEEIYALNSDDVNEAQNNYLDSVPGGRISIYTAMQYSLLSAIPRQERTAWEGQITFAMSGLRNNRQEGAVRIEGSSLRAVQGTPSSPVVRSGYIPPRLGSN